MTDLEKILLIIAGFECLLSVPVVIWGLKQKGRENDKENPIHETDLKSFIKD